MYIYNTCVYIYIYASRYVYVHTYIHIYIHFVYSIYISYRNHLSDLFPSAARLGALVLRQGQGIGGGSPAHHVHHLLALVSARQVVRRVYCIGQFKFMGCVYI